MDTVNKEAIEELLKKFENDIIMLDAFYQWARNPTSYTAAITRGCSANHELIKENIGKRYHLDSDKAKEIYNRLIPEIENVGIDFATGYLGWEEYIKNIINEKYGEVLREKTLERLNKASQEAKYIVWLYCKVKDEYGLFPQDNDVDYFGDSMDKFDALFNATFKSPLEQTRETVNILIEIGFINELHWIASKECTRRRNEYIFPEYLELLALEIDKYIPLPELPNYEKYIGALCDNKVMDALICLDELLHKGCASEIVTIYGKTITDRLHGKLLPQPYIIGKSGNAVAINPRIYEFFKEIFFERKAKELKIEDKMDEGLTNLYEKYYPELSLTETKFELFDASRIWLVDTYNKSLAEYETLIVLTPWLTGKELKWLRDNYSQKFVVIISTFMGLPEIQKLYKELYGPLDESGLNWMIVDVSREKEVYEMIVNAKPKLFDELREVVRGKFELGGLERMIEITPEEVEEEIKTIVKPPIPPPPSNLKILLGRDENNKDIYWEPKKEINWSFVIVGSAGTGKTQTVRAVLSEFIKSKLPYIIFDFRNDYVSKEKESEFGQILDLSTISINPLELDGDNTPKDQKYQISDIVDLVYNIGERQVGYIRSAIKHSYEDRGIKEGDEDSWGNAPPTFDDIQNNLNRISEEGDRGARSSIEGIFARLDPIFDYKIFSAETVMPFEKIMKGQTVVNLGTLSNEKLKAVVCEFFMRKLRYYLDKIGGSRDPRLYVVIDEAHRLKYEREASAGQLLKEARKYGVGMLLSTQDPVDFTDVVYNNIGGIMSLQLTDPKYAKSIAEHLGGKVTWQNVKNDLSSKFSAYVKFSQNPDAIRFDVTPHFER